MSASARKNAKRTDSNESAAGDPGRRPIRRRSTQPCRRRGGRAARPGRRTGRRSRPGRASRPARPGLAAPEQEQTAQEFDPGQDRRGAAQQSAGEREAVIQQRGIKLLKIREFSPARPRRTPVLSSQRRIRAQIDFERKFHGLPRSSGAGADSARRHLGVTARHFPGRRDSHIGPPGRRPPPGKPGTWVLAQ